MKPQETSKALSDREFVVEHTFHASAAKVFAAYIDPKLVAQWWAPKGGSIRVEELDARPGGRWRHVQRNPNGQQATFSGIFMEIQPVTRLVYTFQVEGQPGSEITATVDLKESGTTTLLTLTSLCGSRAQRDAMVKYGAAAGA